MSAEGRKRAIYIRMPRTGSTSLVHFCREKSLDFFGGANMGFWEGPQNKDFLQEPFLNEPTDKKLAQCVRNYVGESVYSNSLIFSSVRNPWARAVSCWKHPSFRHIQSFEEFVEYLESGSLSPIQKWHVTSVYEHLFERQHRLVDFLIRFENFQNDFDILCDQIGFCRSKIPHRNSSNVAAYRSYYSNKTRKAVGKMYAKDIDFFEYSF